MAIGPLIRRMDRCGIRRLVVVDWAPYRYGHWVWLNLWGWTWIDDQPWGFAPCHYGRWIHGTRGWGWAAGPAQLSSPGLCAGACRMARWPLSARRT